MSRGIEKMQRNGFGKTIHENLTARQKTVRGFAGVYQYHRQRREVHLARMLRSNQRTFECPGPTTMKPEAFSPRRRLRRQFKTPTGVLNSKRCFPFFWENAAWRAGGNFRFHGGWFAICRGRVLFYCSDLVRFVFSCRALTPLRLQYLSAKQKRSESLFYGIHCVFLLDCEN